ncbi:MAG: hypothetical protein GF393_11460 [Armatimonadia bacterium]|nr:hypothetical protein [Armatimonadia bacterium]
MSDQQTIRVGIIGTGRRGRLLARCIRLCEPEHREQLHRQLRGLPAPIHWDAEIVAAADEVEDCRDSGREVLPEDCAVYEDPMRVIEAPDVDLVVVATASIAHARWSVAALEAGKDVICEKPMVTTLQDADSIVDAAQRSGRIFGLSMQNRYSFWATTIGDLVAAGEMGDVAMMWCNEFRCPFWERPTTDDWISDMKASGGPFLEKNSHHWDIFNMWAQSPAIRVFAGTRDTGSHADKGDIWDCAVSTVEYRNGIMASHNLSLMTRFGHNLEMGMIGTGGWVQAERTGDGGTVTFRDNLSPNERVYHANLKGLGLIGHAGAEIPMFNHLFDCLRRREHPQTSAVWGRESILVGLAAQRSADEDRAVEIQELRDESRFPDLLPEYAD